MSHEPKYVTFFLIFPSGGNV